MDINVFFSIQNYYIYFENFKHDLRAILRCLELRMWAEAGLFASNLRGLSQKFPLKLFFFSAKRRREWGSECDDKSPLIIIR